MPDVLETLETIQQESASLATLLSGDDGAAVRPSARAAADPTYKRRLGAVAKVLAEVKQGQRPAWVLKEVMSTSDFPLLFGDILDRTALAYYRAYPTIWPSHIARRTVNDFRTVNLHGLLGGRAYLSEAVPEGTEYPAGTVTEQRYQLSVKKYGRRFPLTWETLVNDDMNLMDDIPRRMADAARITEDRFATDLYVGSAGPDATFYASGNANVITSNPALSIAGLQTAMTVLGAMEDTDGEPIFIDQVELVVPPALAVVAQNILNATELTIDPNSSAGTAQQVLTTSNWMANRMRLTVNPYIPQIASSNQNTSWFLFAKPEGGRAAATLAFLRGNEEPALFVKESNQRRIGGGGTNPLDGSFETDTVEYKVRHVLGGVLLDPKFSVASNGSGS